MSLISKMASTRNGDKRPREKNLIISGKRMRELVDYARKTVHSIKNCILISEKIINFLTFLPSPNRR